MTCDGIALIAKFQCRQSGQNRSKRRGLTEEQIAHGNYSAQVLTSIVTPPGGTE